MRRVVGSLSLSLDGRVNGPGGDYDMGWIVPHAVSDTARDHMIRVTAPATTALLGRKNYQGFSGYWPGVADDVNADPASEVRALRKADGGDIIVLASGSVIRALLAADEVDRLSITLCPAVSGGGARLFEDGVPGSAWSLTDLSTADSGAICLLYDRVREAGTDH